MKLYTVYDKKSEIYWTPFCEKGDIFAQRNLSITVNSPESNILASFPSDFALYCLGEYVEKLGKVKNHKQPVFVCEVSSLVRKSSEGEGHEVSKPEATLPAAGAEE